MKVGFTGSSKHVTDSQLRRFRSTLVNIRKQIPIDAFHHGDCIKADEKAHTIALSLGIPVEIHPPINDKARAFCKGAAKVHQPKTYLVRNHDIVDSTDVLIAMPSSKTEVLRSGTWATVRYAQKCKKPVVFVYP